MTYNTQVSAFIDETGNSNIDSSKPGVSSHFIVAAVIVDRQKVDQVRDRVEKIAEDEFQGSEIKSSNVRSNSKERRVRIWKKLMDSGIYAAILLVDKTDLTTEGYEYKKSFFKNLHGKLDRHLLRTYPDIYIYADEHGDDEYMKSFCEYIKKKQPGGELFPRQSFEFVDSRCDRLIQAADFIAGTAGHAHEKDKADTDIRKMIHSDSKIKFIRYPTIHSSVPESSLNHEEDDSPYSPMIAQLAAHRAQSFIMDKEGSSDDSVRDQVACIQLLLDHFQYVNEEEYIPTKKIIELISTSRDEGISKDTFRRTVVGKVRDAGVLLASNSQKPYGYKIPCSKRDIDDFLSHYTSVALPMLHRIGIARDSLRDASKGDFDILDFPQYCKVKHILNSLQDIPFNETDINPELENGRK